jgi:hypothetical protein
MVDGMTQNCVDVAIQVKVKAGELFTAFDISNAVKQVLRNSGEFVPSVHRHSLMRDYVNLSLNDILGNFNIYNYTRTLCKVSSTESAYVYHMQNDDPSSYVGIGISNPVPQVKTSQAPSVNVVQQSAVVNSDAKMPDARGTICVPSSYLVDAGFSKYDSAYIYKHNDGLLVTKTQAAVSPDAIYTVDSHSNVRITKYTLDKFGMNSSNGYVFKSESNGVLVKVA